MLRTLEQPMRIGSIFDALCLALWLIVAIVASSSGVVTSIAANAWIEGVLALVNSAFGSD